MDDPAVAAFVEQLLCADADDIVLNMFSTFSRHIARLDPSPNPNPSPNPSPSPSPSPSPNPNLHPHLPQATAFYRREGYRRKCRPGDLVRVRIRP